MSKYVYTAREVAEMLEVSLATGYKIVKTLNEELKANGYIIVAGKVPKKFFREKFYCDNISE